MGLKNSPHITDSLPSSAPSSVLERFNSRRESMRRRSAERAAQIQAINTIAADAHAASAQALKDELNSAHPEIGEQLAS